ncbi:GtrA family protein [Catenulispora rubra]|uniref:GtrA family protein n=1 Tax=Catenulispora rubra TaxID=280293 RepID=UPI00189234F5|nr:GtrA family protein [Catenulispora rubra]
MLVAKVVSTIRKLYAEMLKFGVVGAVGVASDIGSSNLLWKYTGLSHTVASVGGTCVATVTAYIGNRYWVFRDRPADARRREMAMFALISLIGLIIENSFVFVGDRVLGFHSIAAANVAKFVLGLPIAGVFRFTTSHLFVFPEATGASAETSSNVAARSTSSPAGSASNDGDDALPNQGADPDDGFSAQSPTTASAP